MVRTETNTINRYSSGARGVIVMRLNAGDKVVGIAAFRAGLAQRGGMADNAPGGTDAGARTAGSPSDATARSPGDSLASGDQFDVYTGNANPELARNICRYLGIDLGRAEVFEFANENIFVRIIDNAREKDVFLIQPTSRPVNKSIMELLIMIDAFKRASAGRITAVVPYYGYGRSDKKDQPRVPITARLIADMMTVAGANRILTVDLHQGQIQGFFNIPVDELTAVHLLSGHFRQKNLENLVVVTDLGFAKRARTFAELLDAPLAIVEKRRIGNQDRAEVLNVIGDVRGKRAIIVDDEIDTAGTLIQITRRPAARGRDRDVCLRHSRRPVGTGQSSASPIRPFARSWSPTRSRSRRRSAAAKIKVISLAPLIAEAIVRIHRGQSVGALSPAKCSSPRRCCCGTVEAGSGAASRRRRRSLTGGRRTPQRGPSAGRSSGPRGSDALTGGGRRRG